MQIFHPSTYSRLRKYTLPTILFLSTLGITILKVDMFALLRMGIPAKVFYILFFLSLSLLFFLLYKKYAHEKRISFLKMFLLFTFPTEIILFLATNFTHNFHWIFNVMSGAWLLLLGFFVIKQYKDAHYLKDSEKKSSEKLYTPLTLTFLVTITIIHLAFGFYHLGKAAYVDERLWTYSNEKRIEKYWNNILERDWKNTRPSDKPGVTLALLSGPSLLFTTPSDFKDDISDKKAFEHMLFSLRVPLMLFSTLAIILFFHVISTLTNTKIGLFTSAFIGLSPILLGVSRIINPDALSWIFIPLSLLSFLTYYKTRAFRWVVITGILLGLGLLTKYITNIIFLFMLVSLFTYAFFGTYTRKKLRTHLRESLAAIGTISLIAIMTFFILYPGTWVKLDRILLGTIWSQPFEPIWQYFVIFVGILAADYFFNQSSLVLWATLQLRKIRKLFILLIPSLFLVALVLILYSTYTTPQSIPFENYLLSPKTALSDHGEATQGEAFITSFYTLLFGIAPIAAIGVLLSLLFSFSKKYTSPLQQTILWHILFFIIIFYAGSVFSSVIPTVRYQIILYPLILVVAACGWYFFVKTCLAKNIFLSTLFLSVIIIFTSSYTLFTIKPFYFSYNSALLPKDRIINPKNMGDGNYEAAQFLNTLPDAKNLNVWSDKNGVCTFFIGTCVNVTKKNEFIEYGPHYDYFVISKSREAQTISRSQNYSQMRPDYPIRLDILYLEKPEAVFEIFPGNRQENYIRIISEENTSVWRGNDAF